jgi:hypothetical protein
MRERRYYLKHHKKPEKKLNYTQKQLRSSTTMNKPSMSSTSPKPTVGSALTLCPCFVFAATHPLDQPIRPLPEETGRPFTIGTWMSVSYQSDQSTISPVSSLGSTPNNAAGKYIELSGH